MKLFKFNNPVTRRTASFADMAANKLNDRVKRLDDKIAADWEETQWAAHEEEHDRKDNAGI